LPVLLASDGSWVVEEAVAEFVMEPVAPAVLATIVTVAEPPAGSVPRLAVTVPFVPAGGPEQVPAVVAHETKVVEAGNGSVNVTAAASAGPAFETVIVKVRSWPGL